MDINERLDKIEKTLVDLQNLLNTLLPITNPVEEPKPVEIPKPLPFKEPISPEKLKALNALKQQNQQKLQSQLNPITAEVPAPDEFTALTNLLNSKKWPHAVDPSLICDITSEQDKEDRAEGILDLIIDVHLENLRFLDFGCGEGHVINRCRTQKPRMAVGYDIKKNDRWEKWDKSPVTFFTDDWNEIKNFGPFNIVLMYDVIDHMLMPEEELVAKLKGIKEMLAVNGRVYLRAHPWCSRHGTHLYHQLNKAFAHLIFTDEELKSLGYKQEEVRKVKYPQQEYEKLFASSGFKILNGPTVIKEGVEPFFNEKPLAERIKLHYLKNSTSSLECQFIDYVLQ